MKRYKPSINQLVLLIVVIANLFVVTCANECPICATSKIVKCIRTNKTLSHNIFNNNVFSTHKLPDYKCTCKYVETDDKSCKNANLKNKNLIQHYTQNETIIDIEKIKTKEQTTSHNLINECLNVYVGMAIRGNNLIHRQWHGKENCFNLCLQTNIKNGDPFNCKSFEHWHRECSPTNTNEDEICASFVENDHLMHRNHKHHNRRAVKMDICVLSNQTIKTSGDDFVPNNVVTYYELICHKPIANIEIKSTKQISNHFTLSKTNTPETSISQTSTITNSPLKTFPQTTSSTTTTQSQFVSLHFDLAKKNKNHTKKYENSFPKEDLILTSKKCKFNPCLNDGACLLIDTQRFTCLCKDFYYGVYCENKGIHKICHRDSMEIVINHHEIIEQLRINMNDIYLNEANTNSTLQCKLKNLNDTHARFLIPYDKCSSKVTNMQFEKVYTNKLYSLVKLDSKFTNDKNEIEKNFLVSLECRVDKTTNTYATHLTTQSNTHNTNFCLVNFLNLKLKAFPDETYRNELLTSTTSISIDNKTTFNFDKKIYVQVSVEHSNKLNELYQILDKYQIKLHLTLSYCWLTPTQNENSNIYQILIENGCPREKVRFHDKAVSSLHFSFSVFDTQAPRDSQFYLHCLPDLCSDSPSVIETSTNEKFKSCQNITNLCQSQYLMSRYQIDQSQIKENIKQILLSSQCNYQLSIGPVFIGETKSKELIQDNSNNKDNIQNIFDINKSNPNVNFNTIIQFVLILFNSAVSMLLL